MSTILQQFLGPIEAIIAQVQEHKVDLFDINLTQLALDFRQDNPVHLAAGAKFIAGLTHLMYLKALKLVPQEEPEETEEFGPLSELFLEEYSGFKIVAELFSEKEREQSFHFPRKPTFDEIEPLKPPLLPQMSLDEFSKLFSTILQEAQKRNVTISEDLYTLTDSIIELRRKLSRARMAFTALFQPDMGKPYLIVMFLAVLELMKSQEARLIVENGELFVESVL